MGRPEQFDQPKHRLLLASQTREVARPQALDVPCNAGHVFISHLSIRPRSGRRQERYDVQRRRVRFLRGLCRLLEEAVIHIQFPLVSAHLDEAAALLLRQIAQV